MRKVLSKPSKSNRVTGVAKGKIGLPLKLLDKNGERLVVGDVIQFKEYKGRLLYNYAFGTYGVALSTSMWYGTDEYDINSYGKFIALPMDNGARMEIEKLI